MLTLDRPYTVADEAAQERMRALTDYWSSKYGVGIEWRSDSAVRITGKRMRVKFAGEVIVADGRIHAEVEVAWIAEKLGARGYCERKIDEYMDEKHSLEELRARIPK